jgi:hypothetical protein
MVLLLQRGLTAEDLRLVTDDERRKLETLKKKAKFVGFKVSSPATVSNLHYLTAT